MLVYCSYLHLWLSVDSVRVCCLFIQTCNNELVVCCQLLRIAVETKVRTSSPLSVHVKQPNPSFVTSSECSSID